MRKEENIFLETVSKVTDASLWSEIIRKQQNTYEVQSFKGGAV